MHLLRARSLDARGRISSAMCTTLTHDSHYTHAHSVMVEDARAPGVDACTLLAASAAIVALWADAKICVCAYTYSYLGASRVHASVEKRFSHLRRALWADDY